LRKRDLRGDGENEQQGDTKRKVKSAMKFHRVPPRATWVSEMCWSTSRESKRRESITTWSGCQQLKRWVGMISAVRWNNRSNEVDRFKP